MKKIFKKLFLLASVVLLYNCTSPLEATKPGALEMDLVDGSQIMFGATVPIKIHVTNPSKTAYTSVKLLANSETLVTLPIGVTDYTYNWTTGAFSPADYTIKLVAVSEDDPDDHPLKSVKVTLSKFDMVLSSPGQQVEFFVDKTLPISVEMTNDNFKLKKLDYLIDNSVIKYHYFSNGNQPTFDSIHFTPTTVGTHTISVIAYSETNTMISKTATVKFSKYGIIIDEPNRQYWKGDIVNISAQVQDQSKLLGKNRAVTKVNFYIDSLLASSVTSSPYLYAWNTQSVSIKTGEHLIIARGYSNHGLEFADTARVLLSTANLSISSPVSGNQYKALEPLPITAVFTENDFRLKNIRIYIDNILRDSLLQAPYIYDWTPAITDVGSHDVIVEAVSTHNFTKRDTCTNVIVNYVNTDIYPTLISPINNDSLAIGTNLVIKVGINDRNRQFKKIEYYLNGIFQSADSSLAYVPGTTDSIAKIKVINTETLNEAVYKVEAKIITKGEKSGSKKMKIKTKNKSDVTLTAFIRLYEHILTFDNLYTNFLNFIPNYMIQTADKGYLLIMVNNATNSTKIFKLDQLGAIEPGWPKDLLNSNSQNVVVNSAIEDVNYNTGYVLAGYQFENSGSGKKDTWVTKINAAGDHVWEKNYGYPGIDDEAAVIKQTTDNGFIIGGYTTDRVNGLVKNITPWASDSVFVNRDQLIQSGKDVRLLKLYSNGNEVWGYAHNFVKNQEWMDTVSCKFGPEDGTQRIMITMGNQNITDLIETNDGYVVTGSCDWDNYKIDYDSLYTDQDFSITRNDMFYSEFSVLGAITKTNTWSRVLGAHLDKMVTTRPYTMAFGDPLYDEEAQAIIPSGSGSYVMAGYAVEIDTKKKNGKNVKRRNLEKDAWLVDYKYSTGDDGVQWETTIGGHLVNDESMDISSVRNGGCITCGYQTNNGIKNFWLYKAGDHLELEWNKIYLPTDAAYNGDNVAILAKQTSDGGFVAAGYATDGAGNKVARLIKVKKSGNAAKKKK